MNKSIIIPSLALVSDISKQQPFSPRTSSKVQSPYLKTIQIPSLSPKSPRQRLEKIFTSEKMMDLKTINVNKRFKVVKTLIEERARSSSPKIKEESKLNQNFFPEIGLVKKYKKMRLENQENQIKVKNLFSELVKLNSEQTNLKKCIEICFQIIDLTFQ